MSLKKIGSNVKSGIGQLGSGAGLKNAAIWAGIGASIGVLMQLFLRALQLFIINKYAGNYAKYDGFSIYPNGANSLYVEDVILIILSFAMLMTKKLWLTIGFTAGWYLSGYLGFYDALSLPKPTTTTTAA